MSTASDDCGGGAWKCATGTVILLDFKLHLFPPAGIRVRPRKVLYRALWNEAIIKVATDTKAVVCGAMPINLVLSWSAMCPAAMCSRQS